MMRVSVADVLAVCSSTYRTIDVRVAVVRNGDQWANAFAALRLSHTTPAAVRQNHKELQRRYGIVRTQQFAVLAGALPFSNWSALCSDLAQGILRVGDVDVRLSPVDIATLSGHVRPSHSGGFLSDPAWPGAEFATGENTEALLRADQVIRALPGYQSPYQAIAAICEADTWPRMFHSYSVLLRLPVLAALSEIRIQPVGQTLKASILQHKNLKGVALHILPTSGAAHVPTGWTTITRLTLQATNGAIQTRCGSTRAPSLHMDDLIEASVSHPALGELDRRTPSVRELLPPAARNLLLEALQQFCSVDQFAGSLPAS